MCGSGNGALGGQVPPARMYPLEEPEWPKHHPAVCMVVASLITSAVEGMLMGGSDK